MLSERLTELFLLLQCTNSDIARFADCSPSNISRLKSGTREPSPNSRSIARLTEGIYRYADFENMLDVICDLCGIQDSRSDVLIPALTTWLYGDRRYVPPQTITPKSKQEKISRQQSFSERLDKVMQFLDYSNSRLAADLNVDPSLVSRYRTGIYHPNRNEQIKAHLTELILDKAEKTGRTKELADLCAADPAELSPETLSEWLYGTEENRNTEIAESFFHSIDSFIPEQNNSNVPLPEHPSVREAERYWGTFGLRDAVIRFLSEAAREGGELLLYSDEPMDWMSGDPDFFMIWASLMKSCLQKGVYIRIIHNIDRNGMEMVSAIRGWFPLYISGNIEPYIFRKTENARFCHTVFLRPGHSCILGFFPAGMGDDRWYNYITDKTQLDALKSMFTAMLDRAAPFLKTYPASAVDSIWNRNHENSGKTDAILRGLSIATMPEELLERMLSRAEINAQRREEALGFYRGSTARFHRILENGELHEYLCLPGTEDIHKGNVTVNFEAETNGLSLAYTAEEYAEHISAVQRLVLQEKNYHLTLLPQSLFQDLQVFTMKDAVAVIRNQKPYTAFVFFNPVLLQSIDYYCEALREKYVSDRQTVNHMLERMCGGEKDNS